MVTTVKEQWVVFRLGKGTFGLNISHVQEMTQLSRINQVPNTPEYVLGTMLLRDRVVPIVDLRLRLDLPSLETEKQDLVELLSAREQDHVQWLKELERAVQENREFTLGRDPHQCAFGRWYDRYQTTDLVLANQLKKFDQPHKAIHAVADQALGLAAEGRSEAAREVIERTRDRELSQMIRLFAETRQMISERVLQIAIILEDRNRLVGLAVDEILSVSKFPQDQIQPPPEMTRNVEERFLLGVAQAEGNGDNLVLLLDETPLLAAAEV